MRNPALLSICTAIAAAAVGLYGCASAPSDQGVYAHAAEGFSPTAYRTWGFLHDEDTSSSAYTTLLMHYLEAAVASELQSRGYHYSPEADLLVNFHVVTRDELQATPTASGYYRWRGAYAWESAAYASNVRSFTEGTVNIDLVDRARRQLVWEGVAIGRVSEERLKVKKVRPAIDSAVADIFASLPGQPEP